MAEKLRLFARNWRPQGMRRTHLYSRRQARLCRTLFANNGTVETPKIALKDNILCRALSTAEPGLGVDSVAFKDGVAFMPGEDSAMYPEGSFEQLFEKSQFVKAMDPVGKEVEADVLAVVEDKLYVDFGCKFHAVVSCPDTVRERVHRGTKVIVVVKDLEVTQAFIGGSKHDSLLEATAQFVRLHV